MKVLILSLALLGTLAVTPVTAMDNADNVLSTNIFKEGHQTLAEEAGTTSFELMPDRPKKSKAGKHGGYGKKAAKGRSKGSSCKRTDKIMRSRGNR